MHSPAGFLALFSVLRGAVALYDLPEPPLPRDEEFADLFEGVVESDILKRSTHDATFPLNFNVANRDLFNGYVVSEIFPIYLVFI